MHVYLLRHGEACWVGGAIRRDEDRTLTARGRQQLEVSLRSMADQLERPHRILHSPYARARQSAEVLAEVLHWTGDLEVTPRLEPGADPHGLLLELAALDSDRVIALVSHEPFAGRLLGLLLTGTDSSSIPLDVGMLAAVEIESTASMVGRLRFAR